MTNSGAGYSRAVPSRQQRDLVCVRDIPPLDSSMPEPSDKYGVHLIPDVHHGYKTKHLGIDRRPTPRYQGIEDYRQDEGLARESTTPGEQSRDNIEEYILGAISSLTATDDFDSKEESVSGDSRLDFSLDRLSGENSSGTRPRNGLDWTEACHDKPNLGVTTDIGNSATALAPDMLELTPKTNNLNSPEATNDAQNQGRSRVDAAVTNSSADQILESCASNTSSEVDRRWELLSAKFAADVRQTGLSGSKSSASDDLHTILDVNGGACFSPKSTSSPTFEDQLIEDCVETGLPSPSKTDTRTEEPTSHFTFSECSSLPSMKPVLAFTQQTDPVADNPTAKETRRMKNSLACSSSLDGFYSGHLTSRVSKQVTRLQGNPSTIQTPPQAGLLHWRINGKLMVQEKLGHRQDMILAEQAIQRNDESSVQCKEDPRDIHSGVHTSVSLGHGTDASAFMRGLSMFEKKASSSFPISNPDSGGTAQSKRVSKDEDTTCNANSKLDSGINVSELQRDTSPNEKTHLYRPESGRGRPRQEDSSSDEGASGLLSPRAKEHPNEDRCLRVSRPLQSAQSALIQNNKLTKVQHAMVPPSMKMMILASQEHFNVGDQAISSSSRSNSEETDYAADILDVSSSLTGTTSKKGDDDDASHKILFCPTPVVAGMTDDDETKTVELVVGVKNMSSFDAKGCALSAGIPSWRIGPAESMSDFKLSIKSRRSGKVDEYHVHKHIMGVGPRNSTVLEKIFRSSAEPSTELIVEDEAASLLPSILDYMYCDDYELELKTETVLAYRHLANLSWIPSILKQTSEFILEDIKIANMNVYISQSSLFGDESMKKLIAAKCGEEVEEIPIDDILWAEMDPALFLQVISCPRIDLKTTSRRLSLLLVNYHALHKRELHAAAFYEMTSVAILPLIDRSAAIPLLEICDAYGAPETLQKLQKRCAHVMGCNWKGTSDRDRKRFFSLLRNLPSTFTVDFLEMVDSGKTANLVDNAMLKMLDSFRQRRSTDENYEDLHSFSIAKLCGLDSTIGDAEHPLNWRMDASQSFSDWTVKIRHKETAKLDMYHVHKHFLAVGQYKSAFFADNFLAGGQANGKRGSMTIELSEESAGLFPVLLDFIYCPDHPVVISSSTAPGLRYLSRVFGVFLLNKRVIEFVQTDMCLSNMVQYLDNADIYDDERIRSIAVYKCAKDIRDVDPESKLLVRMPPSLFGRIIASGDIDKSASCHINVLIAKYFTLHDLSETLLAELMKQVQMKEIDQDSALRLLHVMGSVKNKNIAIFSEICQRCATILVENWRDLRRDNREECFRVLRTLGDSGLVADVFEAVESDNNAELYETVLTQSRLIQRYRAELSHAETQREKDLGHIRHEHELIVTRLLQYQKELESQVESYQDASDRRGIRSNSGGFRYLSPLRSPQRNSMATPLEDVTARFDTLWAKLDRKGGHLSPVEKQTRHVEPSQHNPYLSHEPSHRRRSDEQRALRSHPSRVSGHEESECESHASIFSQVFGCTPVIPFDENQGPQEESSNLFPPVAREHLASVDR